MPIPNTPRILYRKNPLEEVICQLRFPTVLRIGTEEPVAFQERVRQHFPFFSKKQAGLEIPEGISNILSEFLPDRAGKEYRFISEDKNWALTLTRDFLALSANAYERWEEFRSRLETPIDALGNEYAPAFFSRLGLRYRNVIRRSQLGLMESKWADLLQPHIASELASAVSDDVENLSHQTTLRLRGSSRVRIRRGLTEPRAMEEACYIIDCDYFDNGKTEIENAISKLDDFNRESGKFFRWCITDRLHQAMEPAPI